MNAADAYVGQRVRIVVPPEPELQFGTITVMKPENGGCLVRPDWSQYAFGWGWSELEPEPIIIGPSVWEILLNPQVGV